jgi:hypothetical protein
VVERALPIGLVSDLYGRHRGRPILIIGGGPSTPASFEKIRGDHDWLIIGANAHAYKLGLTPTYVFCKDDVSTETKLPMEPTVRRPGVEVIGRHFWCDYRCQRWPITGNSGQMAIAVAALMGGCPIVPLGLDGFQNDTVYFHSEQPEKNVSLGRPIGYWEARHNKMAGNLQGAVIRSPGGPTARAWPKYRASESYPKPVIPLIFARYQGVKTHTVLTKRIRKPLQFGHVTIPSHATIIVDDQEKAALSKMGLLEPC